ncbi:hypothetical protein DVH24_013575 [Malus domestica]|uniref:Uncharacterized protein n=1 Tax=Malus domestica TaxID=3750 RepID=A0A498JB11_MALDO|nr:hypothetical protein DVH24_013575 [Malus domestica]
MEICNGSRDGAATMSNKDVNGKAVIKHQGLWSRVLAGKKALDQSEDVKYSDAAKQDELMETCNAAEMVVLLRDYLREPKLRQVVVLECRSVALPIQHEYNASASKKVTPTEDDGFHVLREREREMAGALIGEAFLSASIQTLCDKIASGEFMDFLRGKKLDHSLLEKLKLTFLTLDAVLDDAEEKQIEKPRVRKWLDELKHAVFDAEDLLAEIDTEVLRSKVEADEYQTKKTSQVWNFLSTSFSPFCQGMNGRIQELFQRLEHLAKQKDLLGLVGGVKENVSQRKLTTSLVEHEFSPCGRDGDKEKLTRLLLSDDTIIKCLRVLSLSRYKNITQLPDNIGKHLNLRHVDLSHTAIKKLPGMMCTLYNLQTLLLVGCSSLVELPADIRKLINLRHLDISGTCIKEMPVQMCRLKSLRTLTAFVLGESTRSGGIGELGQLSNLRGKLSILNLQNVVNHMDALGANLKDKKDLNEVELAWGREDANDSVKERHVLESLQPSVNLVKLTIRFYGGTSFPDWLGDSSFSNIQVMRLSECSTCLSLPPVGRLPALEELYIERMKFVVSIGVEFYGGNGASLSQPFQSLKKLKFKEMPEWEEWLPCPGRGQSLDFPRLEELSLENCPKLRGNLPDHLPSLRQLWVSDCGVLHERATRTRWIPWSLIVNTESLRQSLEQLKIVRCPGLSSLLEKESLSSLSKLEIQFFSRGECLRPHLSNCLKDLTLYNCASLLSFPRNGLPTSLTFLHIENCRRLEFLSHEMMAKLTSLQLLNLVNSCDSLRSFPLGVFPKLSVLQILDNKNLESLAIGEGADDENLTHLDHLGIFDCPNLVSFPHGGLRTPKLAGFIVDGCEKLKLLPDRIHTLTALRRLRIYGLPNVESFAEGGLPPNLQSFAISGCEKLRPSVEYWGLQRLVSLRTFEIWSSEDLLETVLKEQLLPTTLHSLVISGMESLKSLEGKGLQHLTSLQELEIRVCDSLEFLPKEGLPASLSFLSIEKCSSLEKRCQKKTGQETISSKGNMCLRT